jgi:hypothetical protein
MNRRFFWSLLLAVLLPLAQVAAAAHEVTHVRAALSDKSSQPAPHCDLCVVAAAVTGGGATSSAPVVVHATAVEHRAAWQPQAPQTPAHVAHFLSRAPPFLR